MRSRRELMMYLAFWLILFVAPVISLYVRMVNDGRLTFDWGEIFNVWKYITFFLVTFLIHNFLLAPLLVYRRKTLTYLLSTACLLAVFLTVQCIYSIGFGHPHHPGHVHSESHVAHIRHGMSPDMGFGNEDVVGAIGAFMLLGMNLGVKLYFKSENDIERMKTLERQNLERQLEYLKYQVNPHFFMNTLNNIYALVDIEPPKAKVMLVELSKMMRYILYDGSKSLIPLEKEMQFLNNYLTLMRLRFTDNVKIGLGVEGCVSDKFIPPLLFIIFVENAFKHGVSYNSASFIDIKVKSSDDSVSFSCENSKSNHTAGEHGGMGLANVIKRLDLIYGDNYTLDINNGDQTFGVKLHIPFCQKNTIT